mgnify:CR=1 FL=1
MSAPGTLTAKQQLARTLYQQGARAEGIALLETVVRDFEALHDPSQPEANDARRSLLELYRREGRALGLVEHGLGGSSAVLRE